MYNFIHDRCIVIYFCDTENNLHTAIVVWREYLFFASYVHMLFIGEAKKMSVCLVLVSKNAHIVITLEKGR